MRVAVLALAMVGWLAAPGRVAAQDAQSSSPPPEASAEASEPESDAAGENAETQPEASEPEERAEPARTVEPVLTESGANPTAPTVVPAPGTQTPGTSPAAILGVTTVIAAVGTAMGIGLAVERDDSVQQCERYAMEDPRTRGCLNEGTIRDQRDVGIGLAIGFGALAIGAGIAWAIVAASEPASPLEAQVTCAPGALSFACVGRF